MNKMEIIREEWGRYVDMIAANIILREYMENHREEIERMRGGMEWTVNEQTVSD